MNFLAHLYLSGDNVNLQIGNFIGDGVKGRDYKNYQLPIQNGILLHRKIDTYTDKHHSFINSKRKISHEYSYFSGIVIDILYDHFLSKNWSLYSVQDRTEFAHNVYNTMLINYTILPKKLQLMIPNMIQNNWLEMYAETQGIERVLKGLSKRTVLPDRVDNVMRIFENRYYEFYDDFVDFFQDISNYVIIKHRIDLSMHYRLI